jgi:hypothetical protein
MKGTMGVQNLEKYKWIIQRSIYLFVPSVTKYLPPLFPHRNKNCSGKPPSVMQISK